MAARLRRTPGRPGGERREGLGLAAVHRVVGLVGAGEVAEREHRREAREQLGARRRARPAQAEAVHAAVELQRAGRARRDRARNRRVAPRLLRHGTRSKVAAQARRRPASGRRRRGSPGRGRAPRAARRLPRPAPRRRCGRRRRRAPAPTRGGAEAVGVGLDHGGGLDRGAESASSARQLAAMASRSMVRRARAMATVSWPEGRAWQRAASVAWRSSPCAAAFHPAGSVYGRRRSRPADAGGAHERDGTSAAEAAPAAEALSRADDRRGAGGGRGGRPRRAGGAARAAARGRRRRPPRADQPAGAQALIALWGVELDGAVLSELEEGVRDEIVARAARRHPRGGGAGPRDRRRRLSRRGHGGAAAGAHPARARRRRPGRGRAVAAVRRVLGRAADAARGGGGARALDGRRRHRLHARRGVAAGELLRPDHRRPADASGRHGAARPADGRGARRRRSAS